MDKAQILKTIGSIGRASTKLTRDIQTCAVGCVEHAVKHGDVTLADQLVDALGKGMRKASLRAWFETNGPMFIAQGKTVFSFDKERRGQWDAFRETELLAKPWEEAKPEPEVVSVFDVSEAFDKFMKRIEKLAGDGEVVVRNRELMAMLTQVSADYHGDQAAKARIAE